MKTALLVLLVAVAGVHAQSTNTVRLTPSTALVWNANTEPDISGYWAMMRQGTNIWRAFVTEPTAKVLAINPATTNGVYSFSVVAVNRNGMESDAAPAISATLSKPPLTVNGIKLEAPLVIRFE